MQNVNMRTGRQGVHGCQWMLSQFKMTMKRKNGTVERAGRRNGSEDSREDGQVDEGRVKFGGSAEIKGPIKTPTFKDRTSPRLSSLFSLSYPRHS